MKVMDLSLSRQMDLVFREIDVELAATRSGTVFFQLRNNVIGKFGVKHDPIQSKEGNLQSQPQGLTKLQREQLKTWTLEALRFKRGWSHGEIQMEFSLMGEHLKASLQYESNYNLAAITQF